MIHGRLSLQIHMCSGAQAMVLGKLRAELRKVSVSEKAEKERQEKWDYKKGRASWKASTCGDVTQRIGILGLTTCDSRPGLVEMRGEKGK